MRIPQTAQETETETETEIQTQAQGSRSQGSTTKLWSISKRNDNILYIQCMKL